MNLKEWLRSVQIFNAISSPTFSALRNSARLSILRLISFSCSPHRPIAPPVLTQSSDPNLSGSLEERHRCGETMSGDPRGHALLGRRTLYGVREGEAASREKEKASVGRGKAELFPLQGGEVRLNLKSCFLRPFRFNPQVHFFLQ
jgi:hypothetical protein